MKYVRLGYIGLSGLNRKTAMKQIDALARVPRPPKQNVRKVFRAFKRIWEKGGTGTVRR